MRKLIFALALTMASCVPRSSNSAPSAGVKPEDVVVYPTKVEWQLIGDIDGCKLYMRCVPISMATCQMIYWTVCRTTDGSNPFTAISTN